MSRCGNECIELSELELVSLEISVITDFEALSEAPIHVGEVEKIKRPGKHS
jgi:AMMECR1 domain-containing protein